MEYKLKSILIKLEKEEKREITPENLAERTGVTEEIIQKMLRSHYDPQLGKGIFFEQVLQVANKLNLEITDLVDLKKNMKNENIRTLQLDVENKKNTRSNTRKNAKCKSGKEFINAMEGSRYIDLYKSVPDLLKLIAEFIDEIKILNINKKIIAGVVENFNLKTENENVVCRVVVGGLSNDEIIIKDILTGKSTTETKYYKDVYKKYVHKIGNPKISSRKDVEALIDIIKEVMEYHK